MTEARFKLYYSCVVSPRVDDTYKVLKEFTYKDVIVPISYYTNGVNVPRIAYSRYNKEE